MNCADAKLWIQREVIPAQARGWVEVEKLQSRLSPEDYSSMTAAITKTDKLVEELLEASGLKFASTFREFRIAANVQALLWLDLCADHIRNKCTCCTNLTQRNSGFVDFVLGRR